jgi:PPK2 family polyphosphate:nucleotide phosphotransferase
LTIAAVGDAPHNAAMFESDYLVRPGKKFNLKDFPTDDTGPFDDKEDAAKAIEKNLERLAELQEVLYAESKHALLIVLQAIDAGGKDGAIRHVFSGVNPQGCTVTSFKKPTELELAHDFLWRVHLAVPPRGMIGIFNRSHYESVIVERVNDLVPKDVWSKRYDHINHFERNLADANVTILKFFFNISKDEQKRRLETRLEEPEKMWKFNPADLDARKRWGEYQAAFDDMLERCSTEYAPWYVIPADRKWFRNWVLSETIVKAMESLDMKFPSPLPAAELDKIRIE